MKKVYAPVIAMSVVFGSIAGLFYDTHRRIAEELKKQHVELEIIKVDINYLKDKNDMLIEELRALQVVDPINDTDARFIESVEMESAISYNE